MTTTIYTHPSFDKHETPKEHSESPQRYETLLHTLKDFPQTTPEHTNVDDLILKAHTKNYMSFLEEAVVEDEITCIDEKDTYLSNHSIDAAKQAITNICQAVDDIQSKNIQRAFCLSRPPGHHAEPNKTGGFCLFNTVYIGALHAREKGYKRILILDFDVHHGNGTEEMFKKHTPDNMLFISSHESPLYPWTGTNSTHNVHNHTFEAGTDGKAMRQLYTKTILPIIHDFQPDLLLISAGFDAHAADPHANLNWNEDDYAWLGQQLKQYQTVSVLEGGYNLPALKGSVLAYINSLDN